MSPQARFIISVIGVLFVVTLGFYFLNHFSPVKPLPTAPSFSRTNLSTYKNYPFGNDDTVIDIGVQPLWLPGVITETMKRDKTLIDDLAKLGKTIRFHSFLKGNDVNFFLSNGKLEAGVGGDMPTLTACAKTHITVTSLISQSFSSIISQRFFMINELKKKNIAYGYGSNAHRMLMTILAANGLGEEDVHLIPYEVSDMGHALLSGKVDAFAAWEPLPSIMLENHPKLITLAKGLTTGYLYFGNTFAHENRESVKSIVASQIRSMKWLRQKRENLVIASQWTLQEGTVLAGTDTQISRENLADIVSKGLLGSSSIGTLPPKGLTKSGSLFQEFQFLQDKGIISQKVQWGIIRNCFDKTLIDEVVSSNILDVTNFQLIEGRDND